MVSPTSPPASDPGFRGFTPGEERMRFTSALISWSTLFFCLPTGVAQRPTLPDSVDRFVKAELTRQRIPGVSVAIVRGDSILLARGYGVANVRQRIAATDSTVYSVGSLTKPFTAAGIVLLSQQGKLKLEDPIARSLPEGK